MKATVAIDTLLDHCSGLLVQKDIAPPAGVFFQALDKRLQTALEFGDIRGGHFMGGCYLH